MEHYQNRNKSSKEDKALLAKLTTSLSTVEVLNGKIKALKEDKRRLKNSTEKLKNDNDDLIGANAELSAKLTKLEASLGSAQNKLSGLQNSRSNPPNSKKRKKNENEENDVNEPMKTSKKTELDSPHHFVQVVSDKPIEPFELKYGGDKEDKKKQKQL